MQDKQDILNTAKQLKNELVEKLKAQNLSDEQQNVLIAALTNALLERAALSLLSKLPENILAQIATENINDSEQLLEYIYSYVPNAEEEIKKAFKEGINLYLQELENSQD